MELEHAYETVNLYRRGGELRIELNRPGRPERLDAAGRRTTSTTPSSAREATTTCARSSSRAPGRAFSSGADLRAGLRAHGGRAPRRGHRPARRYHPVILGVRALPKPVIAAVNGAAAGIGCSLALACDLVVARESAYFLLAFVNIGLVPDGGSSAFVPARAGAAAGGRDGDAGRAHPGRAGARSGAWSTASAADDDFAGEVDALAARLAAGPTGSYAGTKRQLNAWGYRGLEEQLELEATSSRSSRRSGDFAEGVSAFLQKRAPRVPGR